MDPGSLSYDFPVNDLEAEMSKLSESFELQMAPDGASLACRKAIASIGWDIKVLESNRIVPKVGVGLSRNPSKIEVLIAGEDQATVTLNGSIAGVGPLQKSHLRGEMNKLRNAIEVAAT